MKRKLIISLGLAMWFFLFSTSSQGEEAMTLSSSAFKDGGKIPSHYVMQAIGGKNNSLPLSWKNSPKGTKSFAVCIVDPHPVARNWLHWLVINIPASTNALEEGVSRKAMPAGAIELKNSYGEIGYGGPQPPKGTGDHPYVITLYALSVEKLELAPNAGLNGFMEAIKGKVLAESKITGYYAQ